MDKRAPLGLPEGTIRAIIAVLVVGGCVAYLLIYKTLPESLVGIAGIVIGYYFGTRQGEAIGQAKEAVRCIENGGFITAKDVEEKINEPTAPVDKEPQQP
jgi:hypothetical protein